MKNQTDLSDRIDEIRARVDRLPRLTLAHLPTPLEAMPRFAKTLNGPNIFIKRDDCTGLAFGGNKTRHNEFLIARALQDETDIVVWGAGVQSNNCRQTAAACAKAGLDCHLLLSQGHVRAGSVPIQGNLLLDHIVGASYEIVDDEIGEPLDNRIDATASRLRKQGRKTFQWDRKIVKPLAAISYVLCLLEVIEQFQQSGVVPTALYVCSAGSTGAGLVLAKHLLQLQFPIRNICPIRWAWDTQTDMADIATGAAALLGYELRIDTPEVDVDFDYIGPGYGQASAGCLEAMALLARTEGIMLDPVYTAKAMAGLIDHIRHGRFATTDNVVFIHTGGTPALFAYHQELSEKIAARQLLSPTVDPH